MNQNEEIRVLYVQPGKYPEEIKIPNTLETFQKYVCGSIFAWSGQRIVVSFFLWQRNWKSHLQFEASI